MKPFNLEEALAGKPVITRNSRPVKIAGYNEKATHHHLVGWVDGDVQCWTKDGNVFIEGNNCSSDIFMASEKREVWVCLYRFNSILSTINGNSKEDAERLVIENGYKIITTVKIWEEEI